MKIAIINDLHFGVRNDSQIFLQHYKEFFDTVFFPTLDKHGIEYVFDLGDFFDRRKYVNFNTLKFAKENYLDILQKKEIKIIQIIGNHDTYYRSSNDVNSPSLLLDEYRNIKLVENETYEMELDGVKFLFVPWMNPENSTKILKQIAESRAQICLGHFEIAGFEMARGSYCQTGLPSGTFTKFHRTISGHFHIPNHEGFVNYTGNPFQTTWGDFDIDKGFHLFDTETLELEFIKNPKHMFNKIVFDEKVSFKIDLNQFKNTYVKVVIDDQTNQYKLEKFLQKLNDIGLADLKTVKTTNVLEVIENLSVDNIEDTLTVMRHFIDSESNLTDEEKNSTKAFIQELYSEAVNLEV